LIGSGDISGVGAFVRSEVAAGEREREGTPSPDVSEEKAGEFVSARTAQLDEAERKRLHKLIVPLRGEKRLSDDEILDAIEKAAPILSKSNRAWLRNEVRYRLSSVDSSSGSAFFTEDLMFSNL
jgi:hypothetical protein